MEYLRQAAQNRMIVLFIAAAVDLLIGDPHWFWHPVQGVGTLISVFEKLLRRLFAVPPPEERAGSAAEGGAEGGTAEEGAGNIHSPGQIELVSSCDSRAGSAKELSSTDGAGFSPAGTSRMKSCDSRRFHRRERIAGALMVLLVLAVSTGLVVFLLWLCGGIHPLLRLLFEGTLCGRLLALRSLGEAGRSVRDPLLRGDTESARRAVSMIVGRDTDRLDAEGIAKAAVETVAENTSDGVTAPLFYMLLLGGAGGMFYKAVNTMDSMTGYKNVRYRYFGTAAARLDDLMNFIPSRLTALFMILACFLPGKSYVPVAKDSAYATEDPVHVPKGFARAAESSTLISGDPAPAVGDPAHAETTEKTVRIPDGAAAFRIWRRDRRKSPSPNSAQTESVCAGALHLRLLGDTWYFGQVHHKAEIGDGGRRVEPEDITRSVRLMNRTAALMFAAGIVLLALMRFE